MSSDAYEILALSMRYVFVLLLLLIVIRAYLWLLRDHRAHQKEKRSLPDAGLVGEIVLTDSGKAYPLPREGTIGSSRASDIYVKRPGVRRLHATLRFVDGKGVSVVPHMHAHVELDGEPVGANAYALHGSTLYVADCPLRIRLFAGLNVPRLARYAREEAVDEFVPDDSFIDETPLTDDDQMTWNYAPYPPELLRQMAREQGLTDASFGAPMDKGADTPFPADAPAPYADDADDGNGGDLL